MGASIKDGIVLGLGANLGNTIGRLITAPISAAGNAIKGFLDQSFAKGQNFEQFEASLKTIIGDAGKAKEAIADLSEFARTTPFELPELQTASRSLLAFGFESQKLIPTLKTVGDIASGVSIPIGELADIYGKARVQGRLFAEDINQLTGRGVPVIQELAKIFGVTDAEVRKLVESGKVGFPELEKAFNNLTGAGGKFFNQMENQSKTFAGQLSNFNDQFTKLQVDLFNALKPASTTVLDTFSKIVGRVGESEGIFKEINTAAEEFADTFKDNPELVKATSEATNTGIVSALKASGEIAQQLTGYLKENPQAIAQSINALKTFVELLGQGARFAVQISQLIPGAAGILGSEAGVDRSKLDARVETLKKIGPSAVGKNSLNVSEEDFTIEALRQLQEEERRARQVRSAIGQGRSPDRLDMITPQEASVDDFREAIRRGRKIGALPEPPKPKEKEEPPKPAPKPAPVTPKVDPDKIAEKAINRAIELEIKRSIEIAKLVRQGVLTQEQAEIEKLKATEKRIQAEITAETQKLKGQKGDEAEKTRRSILENNLKLAETQLAIEERYREAIRKGSEALQERLNNRSKELDLANGAISLEQEKLKLFDAQKSAIDGLIGSLDREKSIRESLAELDKTRLDAETSGIDIRIGNLERARGLVRDLQSGKLSADEAGAVRQDLASIGINANSSELQIAQQLNQLQQERQALELRSLEKQQELARKNLDFEQRRLELATRKAEIESRQAIESARLQSLQSQNQARQEGLSAQGNLLKARLDLKDASTAEEREAASARIKLAEQEIALANEKAGIARRSGDLAVSQAEQSRQNALEDLKAQEEKLRIQREQLGITQQTEKDRLLDSQRDRRFDGLRDTARLRSPLTQSGQGFATVPLISEVQWQSRFTNTTTIPISPALNRPVPAVPPAAPDAVTNPANVSGTISDVVPRLDKIIDLLKRPNVVQNNTINQSIGGGSEADILRKARVQTLETMRSVVEKIELI